MKWRWWYLLLFVPLVTGGTMLVLLLKNRAGDQGLVAAEVTGAIVARQSLAAWDIRDDHDKPLTRAQKDRLCYDVLNPALKGQRVVAEQIINYQNGTGQVKATLADAGGNQSLFMFGTTKSPEGVKIPVRGLLYAVWDYQVDPSGTSNIPPTERLNRRAPFVREAAPKLEAIGITELKAEDGQFYPVSQLADVYASWQ